MPKPFRHTPVLLGIAHTTSAGHFSGHVAVSVPFLIISAGGVAEFGNTPDVDNSRTIAVT